MLKSQTLALRASEIRTKLAALSGAEGELSDEARAEIGTLRTEYVDVETRFQAASTVEDVREVETAESSEGREVIELRSKSSVASYLSAAVEMRAIKDGPEAEYNSALGMGADKFPLSLLAPEIRQTTDTDVSTNQRTWLDRLFDATAAQRLGVTFSSVGPGVASFPVTTAGATAKQYAKSADAGAAAWSIGVTEMRPKSNRVHAIFSIEDSARIGPGLEAALRRDLSAALVEGIDRTIFNGDSSPGGTTADIRAFLRNWRHFWHDGLALSSCSRGMKSPHSVRRRPPTEFSGFRSSFRMWVFGFAMERRLSSIGSTPARVRSLLGDPGATPGPGRADRRGHHRSEPTRRVDAAWLILSCPSDKTTGVTPVVLQPRDGRLACFRASS